MIGELMNHLWQSTLFAVVAGLLAIAFRKNRAQIRYRLWLAASLKFLVPFSWLISLGSHLGWAPDPKKMTTQAVSYTMVQVAQPFDTLSFVKTAPRTDWPLIAILGMWVCGFGVISIMRLRTWLRIRAAVCSSTSLAIPGMVDVRSSAGLLEPGVAGLFQPILLLPEGIAERLTPPQLEAVLAHELCHVRRRDNLTAAIHMVVEAVFWFHPLVWWIGVELVKERERACDEEVLRLGSEPQVYAEGILGVCKFYVESPLACVAGVTGPSLRRRVELIMKNHVGEPLSTWRRTFLAAVGVLAVALPIVLGLVTATTSRAQSQAENPGASTPPYEVASVKPVKSGGGMPIMGWVSPDRYTTRGTLNSLIKEAYEVQDDQLVGVPKQLGSERYDIEAKIDPSIGGKLDFDHRMLQGRLILQSLLADRFKLTLHHEAKELPVYALVIAKNGPEMRQATPGDTYPDGMKDMYGKGHGMVIARGPGGIVGQGVPFAVLVAELQHQHLGRTVVDKTGLTGMFDFRLQWTPDESHAPIKGPEDGRQGTDNGPPPESVGPSIFTAIQEQLGLRLEPQKAPMEIVVIDHVEAPSEN